MVNSGLKWMNFIATRWCWKRQKRDMGHLPDLLEWVIGQFDIEQYLHLPPLREQHWFEQTTVFDVKIEPSLAICTG